jgi:hypothetical protein
MIGRFAAWTVFVLGITYGVTLVLGLLSLKSSQDPIADPFFSTMELLIVLMLPLIVKAYSLMALAFMILLAGITSSVHFIILTISRQIEAIRLPWVPLFVSFKWPSVSYALGVSILHYLNPQQKTCPKVSLQSSSLLCHDRRDGLTG